MSDPFLAPGATGMLALAAVTFLAAAVNSVAGGGTILTFPVLAAILPATPQRMVVANTTSTIGLLPGSVAAAWAYRSDRKSLPSWSRWLILPSIAGAAVGAGLVLVLPPDWFAALVPWLVLSAAVLFAIQPRLMSQIHGRGASAGVTRELPQQSGGLMLACGLQFLVAVYGGYFGAGIGILMLAMLGMLDLGDIHRLNSLKNVLGMIVNGAAAVLFASGSLLGTSDVSWPHAAVMAASAIGGGLAGSHLARRLPAATVRRGVAIIAFALAGYYFIT